MEKEKVETTIKGPSKTRSAKPGMVRVVVSLTQERYDALEKLAKDESPEYPRPVNEYLSILIGKRFETHLLADLLPAKQGSLLS